MVSDFSFKIRGERCAEEVEESTVMLFIVVYYESIKRELKTKLIYECRCDERLKT